MDSVPIVAITGQVASNLIGTDGFQEADICGITMPITKHNYLVKDPAQIPRVIAEAFHIAGTGRPGPVLVDIAKDALQAATTFDWPASVDLRGYRPVARPHGKQVREAARLMVERGTRGQIIFTGSWVGEIPWPEISAYSVSKAGVRMLARSMARELADRGLDEVHAGPIRRREQSALIDRRLGRPRGLHPDDPVPRITNVGGELELGGRPDDDLFRGDDRDRHRRTRNDLAPGVGAAADREREHHEERRRDPSHDASLRPAVEGTVSKGRRTAISRGAPARP
jgi:hypothetical protein